MIAAKEEFFAVYCAKLGVENCVLESLKNPSKFYDGQKVQNCLDRVSQPLPENCSVSYVSSLAWPAGCPQSLVLQSGETLCS